MTIYITWSLRGSLTWENMIDMVDAAALVYGMLVSISEGALSLMFYAIAQEKKRRRKEREKRMEQMERVAELARRSPDVPVEDIVQEILEK